MADVNLVKAVNTALGQLGKEPVVDLSDASLAQSLAAAKLLRVKDDALDTVLRRHGWICALEYVTLDPSPDAPTNFRYTTGFLAPGDFLRVWEIPNPFYMDLNSSVVPPGEYFAFVNPAALYPEERWQVSVTENNVGAQSWVMTKDDLLSLNVCYLRRAGWNALDSHVRDAIAFEMAARAAYNITGDLAVQKQLEAKAESKVQLAISVDATQEGGQPPWATSTPALLRATSR